MSTSSASNKNTNNLNTLQDVHHTLRMPLQREGRAVKTILTIASLPQKNPMLKIAMQYLHSQEKKHLKKLKSEKARTQFIMGRIALKIGFLNLNKTLQSTQLHQIDITNGVFQYPVIRGIIHQPYEASLTHAKQVICSIITEAGHPIGIDFEPHPMRYLKAYDRVLTTAERTLAKTPKEDLYLQRLNAFWTLREALSKTLRIGFTAPYHIWQVQTLRKHNINKNSYYYEGTYKNFFQLKGYSLCTAKGMLSICLPKKTMLKKPDWFVSACISILNA